MSAAAVMAGVTGGGNRRACAPDPSARNDEHHNSAGRTAAIGRNFGPHRVNITLTHDSTPSSTIDDAASVKKFCAVAPCVDSHQPPVPMNNSRAVCASTGPITLAAPCDEK